MKLIVAHLPHDAMQPVRTELLDLGVARITISEVRSSDPGSERTLRYRGAAMNVQMGSELRLECPAPAFIVPAVVSALQAYGARIALIDLEDLPDAAHAEVPLGVAV